MKTSKKNKNNIVNNEVFYRDFINDIKVDIIEITKKIELEVIELESIINFLVRSIKSIRSNYSINGYVVFNEDYLRDFLVNYDNTKLTSIRLLNYKNQNTYTKRLKNRLSSLITCKYNINVYKAELDELNNCLFKFNDYRDVTFLYNEWCMRNCLNGGSSIFAERLGTINVLNVHKNFKTENVKLKVDHKKSQDYKQRLIDKGLEPYSKEKHLSAIAKGEEYKGEDWLIYFYDETYPFVNWNKGNRVNTKYYKFIPLRSDNIFKSVEEPIAMMKENNDVEELFSYGLGFVNNLNILKNSIPGYLNKFKECKNNNYKD